MTWAGDFKGCPQFFGWKFIVRKPPRRFICTHAGFDVGKDAEDGDEVVSEDIIWIIFVSTIDIFLVFFVPFVSVEAGKDTFNWLHLSRWRPDMSIVDVTD